MLSRKKCSLEKGKLFILSGPSGSGKTTIYEKTLSLKKYKGKLVKTISVTTRLPRTGEKNNRDYIFISPKMFKYKKSAGHFLESMKVFNNFYGTPKKTVNDLLKKGKSVLLCIDVKGANLICKKMKAAITIFVDTPSFAELKKRLIARGSEDMKTINLRLKVAKEEKKFAYKYKYNITNDTLHKAVKELDMILSKELPSL